MPGVTTVWVDNRDDGTRFAATVAVPRFLGDAPTAGVVLVHGAGTWADKKRQWEPFAEALAADGLTAIYPDVRIYDVTNGPADVYYSAVFLREHTELLITNVGLVAGSAGNNSALTAVQTYPAAWQGYVDLYGALSGGAWRHLEPARIASMTTPTLCQVGDRDTWALGNAMTLMAAIDTNNPALPHSMRTYAGGHGFFFSTGNPDAVRAQRECGEFLSWTLLGSARPSWF